MIAIICRPSVAQHSGEGEEGYRFISLLSNCVLCIRMQKLFLVLAKVFARLAQKHLFPFAISSSNGVSLTEATKRSYFNKV